MAKLIMTEGGGEGGSAGAVVATPVAEAAPVAEVVTPASGAEAPVNQTAETAVEGAVEAPPVPEATEEINEVIQAALRESQTTILDWAQGENEARMGLLALAGEGRSYQQGARIVEKQMMKKFSSSDGEKPHILKRPFLAAWNIATLPKALLQKKGTIDSIREAYQDAYERADKASETLVLLSQGTPEMKALGLDIEIATLSEQMDQEENEDNLKKLEKERKKLEGKRDILEIDGEKIPDQIGPLAKSVASAVEESGLLPPDARSNPAAYLQTRIAEAISGDEKRDAFLSKLLDKGVIDSDGKENLGEMFKLVHESPGIKAAKFAGKIGLAAIIGAIAAVYFREKDAKMKAQRGQ